MITKEELYRFCSTFVAERIARIQKNIEDIQMSLTSETKSSAGDKHETGRAMLQLEREKLGQQLAEAEKMKQVLSKVPKDGNTATVGLGGWVVTARADYFLAISAGEFKTQQKSVYCISAATPIAKLLFGKQIGDTVVFKGQDLKIVDIK
ncbi:3-oxoacyl-ACP synthase [Zobellia galactanivorans]|uniref:3-oxoacyl-ACP synthase n=1 Tax=Zobellia galactanivorans (strain DSM 12802 / CCUG 47099 / CIP 106680 / NCIMB 13871 / Dsij) TaxID=63186 RepID=UPI0026E45FD3|nr:3-oxoacyl-ACP synthase [Zobellia galactanivorans]MDO6809044.1 3-oxoacyl-ACP synthase [Zobellia galactanivorans]